jgi:mRNA interferase MazF
MEGFVRGDVVILAFPFSDFSQSKKRPALVLASLGGEDIIVCQITSTIAERAIPLAAKDFEAGSLSRESFIRPDKLFTISSSLINYKAGKLKKEKLNAVLDKTAEIIRRL